MRFIRFFLADRKRNGAAFWSKFSGIPHNIHQDLFDPGAVPHDTRLQNLLLDDKLNAAALDIVPLHRPDRIDQHFHQERFVDKVNLAGLQLGHVQHIVDQRKQIVRGAVGFAQPVLDLLLLDRVADAAHHQMVQTDQSVERRTDLMAHVGKELALGFCSCNCLNRPVMGCGQRQQQKRCHQHDNRQHDNAENGKRLASFRKGPVFHNHHEIPVDVIFKRGEIKQLPDPVDIRIMETERFGILHLLGNLFIAQVCMCARRQYIIKIIRFIQIKGLLDANNIVPRCADHRTIAATDTVFQKAVQNDMALDGIDIAQADQSAHLDSVDLKVVQTNPVQNIFP